MITIISEASRNMVEPISISALIIACISGVGILLKTITDAIGKSSCMSETTISASGSVRKTRRFSGDNHSDSE